MTADGTRIAGLRQLWMQAFEDPAQIPDAFFATAFSPARHCSIWENGTPVSALYWLDCTFQGHRLAYIYAVATDSAFRGQGYARKLLEDTHRKLKQNGYSGALLVPGEPALSAMYAKFGYRTCSTVDEFTCVQGEPVAAIQPIDRFQYARIRRKYLPAGGVLQEDETLAFLQTQAEFYKGRDFVMAASRQGDQLTAHELLGNIQAAPGILRALKIPSGQFRTPGPGRNFAMFLPLCENCPVPSYFGLALD